MAGLQEAGVEGCNLKIISMAPSTWSSGSPIYTKCPCGNWDSRCLSCFLPKASISLPTPVPQKPVLEPPYIESYHRVCTYNETKVMTVKLPKCAPDADPFYTYPMAIRCDCDICSTATTECETAWALLSQVRRGGAKFFPGFTPLVPPASQRV